MAKNTDFIGFTFNERHSSEFNIYSVSDGSRYQDSLIPSPIDYTEQIPGGVGQSYFGSDIDIKEFPLSIAYDKLTERQVRELRNWLAPDAIGELIFDERPYKTYTAKISTSPSLSFICFDTYNKETGKKERVYKGEGSINFICYYPLGVVSGEKKQLGWYREQIDDRIYRSIGGNSSVINYKLEDKEIAVLEKIRGNTIEIGEGEKSPDNPYDISGAQPTKLITCGKNIAANPQFVASNQYQGCVYADCELQPNTTYTISLNIPANEAYYANEYIFKNIKTIGPFSEGKRAFVIVTTTVEISKDSNLQYVNNYGWILFKNQKNYSSSGNAIDLQIEYGDTVTLYQQYSGKTALFPKLEFLYGNNYIYDEYDATTGMKTKRWKRIELDGTESWRTITNPGYAKYVYLLMPSDKAIGYQTSLCSHFINKYGAYSANVGSPGLYTDHTTVSYMYFVSSLATIDEWKAWLAAQKEAGTPVTIVYQIAEPVVTKIEEVSPFSLTSSINDSNIIMNINPEYFNYFTDSIADISLRIYGAKYSNIDEWAASTGMLEDLSNPIEYNKFDSSTGRYGARLYNPGDRETGFKIIFRKTNSELLEQKFWLENSISTTLNESSKNSFTISARSTSTEENIKLYGPVSEEEKFVANTAGYIEINTNNNTITFTYMGTDNEQKTIPAYFLLKKGFMFKIPVTTTGMMYAITEGISELQIDYNYLYY